MMNGFGDADEIKEMQTTIAKLHNVEVRYSGADLTEVNKIDGLIDDTVSAFGSLDGHLVGGCSSLRPNKLILGVFDPVLAVRKLWQVIGENLIIRRGRNMAVCHKLQPRRLVDSTRRD